MASQSPLIWLPAKQTSEVDVAAPVQKLIQTTYGEDPANFASALATLNRTRQDAMRGGASEQTARDLLLKWFHMLEMLELRFPELRTPFPWNDAFTQKQTTQQSLAYEKACVLFNIASALTNYAATRPRLAGNAEGTKSAFTSLRQAAGMLVYIKDNFLHAPSTDMSADVLKVLSGLCLAQATEVFFEKAVDDKKNPTLIAKIASQAATAYAQVSDDTRQWSNKAILERLWHTLTQAKAKLFTSYMQYYRALADDTSGNHGACLVRLTVADAAAKEATSQAADYYRMGAGWLASPTLPNDAAAMLSAIVKQHAAVVAERKATAEKDNDLIYHDVLPTESSLPAIDPVVVAAPISVQEVYASPDVEKTVSPELFARLVPLQVHESASLYSEEKAKLARSESERSQVADMELSTALDYMKLPSSLVPLKAATGQATGGSELDALADPPAEVLEWAAEQQGSLNPEPLFKQNESLRTKTSDELQAITTVLDDDASACERGRAQWGSAKWKQEPGGMGSRTFRNDLRSNRDAHAAAGASDKRVQDLWSSIAQDVQLLAGGRKALEQAYTEAIAASSASGHALRKTSLLDVGEEEEQFEISSDQQLSTLMDEVDQLYGKLVRIKKERQATLTDLKNKLRDDDISQTLVLHRRSPGSTQAIFSQELDKFRAYTKRLTLVNDEQTSTLERLNVAWTELNNLPRVKQASTTHARAASARDALTAKLRAAHQSAQDVRLAVQRGQQFYEDLDAILTQIRQGVDSFVGPRKTQRDTLITQLEWESKAAPTSPAARNQSISSDVSAGMGNLSLNPSVSDAAWARAPPPVSVDRQSSWSSTGAAPPPVPPQAPPKPAASPYDNMFSQGPFASYASSQPPSTPSAASAPTSFPPPSQPPTQTAHHDSTSGGLPPPPGRFQSSYQLPGGSYYGSTAPPPPPAAAPYGLNLQHGTPYVYAPSAPAAASQLSAGSGYLHTTPSPSQPATGYGFPPAPPPPPQPPRQGSQSASSPYPPPPAPQWQQRPAY